MAHLVTGYAGKEHITSADQGSFNASFFGTGQFVMEAGRRFAASIVDNNTVRVFDGDMLMQGRHIRIPPDAYEDMAIGTGTAGRNRADIICMTYEKDAADGTERAYLEVIRGTETEGEPVPPQCVEGNILEGAERNQMPLYLVALRGVVLSGIECMFRTITTYQAMAERYEAEFIKACRDFLGSLTVYDTMDGIDGNTEPQQLAGALALKEFHDAYNALIGTGDISKIGGGTVLGAIVALSQVMAAATASAAGRAGLVPAPAAGAHAKYLRGDGTWQTPPDTNTTYGAATQSAAGLMSAADKKKLDGIAAGANAYVHPTASGSKHIPSGGSSGQILRWSADGTAAWGADNNTTYGAATQSAAGLMSPADKKKLDGMPSSSIEQKTITASSNANFNIDASTSRAYVKNGWCFLFLQGTITIMNASAWTTIGFIEGAKVPCEYFTKGSSGQFRFLPSTNRTQIMVQTGPGTSSYCETSFPCA